ncbi:hypothetical protein VNI00_004932 [Paramarasmius palmivorus]|uniref:Uncharacterized protein n=1 Tax=Paramarasmius palmivorus TaxID=297713 RepID=A0AAW0DJZ5_9AGAR
MLLIHSGYPLWRPGVTDDLPDSYRKVGVSIGDVVAHDGQGGVEYFFNVLYSSHDDRNLGRVPEDFEPLVLPWDITTALYQHSPGSVISSASSKIALQKIINCRSHDHPHTGVPPEFGCGFFLASGANEGAVLVVPEGSRREDHRNEDAFEDYAKKNAMCWFRYINGVRGRRLSGNALILVTGVDKTSNWAMASFNGAETGFVTMEMVPSPSGAQTKYQFQQFAQANAHTGPIGTSRLECSSNQSNQCTFLRGIRAVVGHSRWSSKVSVKTENVQETSFDATGGSFVPCGSRASNNQSNSPSSSPSSKSSSSSFSASLDAAVTTERIPPRDFVYDPCTTVAYYLLEQVPEASVVTVRDNHILGLIQPDDVCLPSDEELLHRMQQRFKIVRENGRYTSILRAIND